MILFLDTSILLAACGSGTGAGRFIIENAAANDWQILVSPYVLSEVKSNLHDLPRRWMAESRLVTPLLSIPGSHAKTQRRKEIDEEGQRILKMN
jgi:predicted nucleic acid-binding protein